MPYISPPSAQITTHYHKQKRYINSAPNSKSELSPAAGGENNNQGYITISSGLADSQRSRRIGIEIDNNPRKELETTDIIADHQPFTPPHIYHQIVAVVCQSRSATTCMEAIEPTLSANRIQYWLAPAVHTGWLGTRLLVPRWKLDVRICVSISRESIRGTTPPFIDAKSQKDELHVDFKNRGYTQDLGACMLDGLNDRSLII